MYLPTAACVLLPLSFAQSATEPAVVDAAAAASNRQIEVNEFIKTDGAEPSYWASFSLADYVQNELASGETRFAFDLREVAVALGSNPRTIVPIERAAAQLSISQDRETQLVQLGDSSRITDHINAVVSQTTPWSGVTVRTLDLFDAVTLPGSTSSGAAIEFTSSAVDLQGTPHLVVKYRSVAPHSFTIDGASFEMNYVGAALINAADKTAPISCFKQSGTVDNAGAISTIDHGVVTQLRLASGARVVTDVPEDLKDFLRTVQFENRQAMQPLDPTLEQPQFRPPWSIDAWVSGRIAEMTLGTVAEQGTNPVPIHTLASVVMTDESIAYAGTAYMNQRDLERGLDIPAEGTTRVESPLTKAYGPAPFGNRLAMLGAGTTGVLVTEPDSEDDDRALLIPLGAVSVAFVDRVRSDRNSRLDYVVAERSTSAWTIVSGSSAIGATTAAGAVIAAGAGGAAAGAVLGGLILVETTDGGSSGTNTAVDPGDTTATLVLNETFNGQCSSGAFELTIRDGTGGRTWRLSASNGAVLNSPPCTAPAGPWTPAPSQAVSQAGVPFTLILPIPDHSCLSATIEVQVNGAPATFTFFGGQQSGSVSNSCF